MILVHPLIDPVIVSFGIFQIRWYGLAYVLGFIIGLYLVKIINRNIKSSLNNKIIEDFFIWSIIGVIIGGRLGYVLFYQTSSLFSEPFECSFSENIHFRSSILRKLCLCQNHNKHGLLFLNNFKTPLILSIT